jgi:hypothetical protein
MEKTFGDLKKLFFSCNPKCGTVLNTENLKKYRELEMATMIPG